MTEQNDQSATATVSGVSISIDPSFADASLFSLGLPSDLSGDTGTGGTGDNGCSGVAAGVSCNPPPPTPSLYLTANTGGPLSLSLQPTKMTAALTLATTPPANSVLVPTSALPSDTTTLQQAAKSLGFQGFDWLQTITNLPNPSPVSECTSPPPCSSLNSPVISLTSNSVPFNDPPPNGYNYFPANYDPYPFYEPLATALNFENIGTSLSFSDLPTDDCIAGPSPGFLATDALAAVLGLPSPCGGISNLAPENSHLGFTTDLVGVDNDFVPGTDCLALGTCVDLSNFEWTDDFNGIPLGALTGLTGTGGADFDSDVPVDPSSGTGGVTLVSVDGVPVPEPSTLTLLAFSVLVFWIVTPRRRWA